MNSDNISAVGIFSFLFVCRVLFVLMYAVTGGSEYANTELVLRPVLGAVFLLVFAVPLFMFIKRFRGTGIVEVSEKASPGLGRLVALFYVATNVYLAIRTVTRFDLFSSSVVYPETDNTLFLIILIAASAYIAMFGIRAIGRGSAFFALLIILTGAFVLSIVASQVDILNLTPLFENGARPFMSDSIKTMTYSVDLLAIPYLLPRIKGNIKKPFIIWLAAQVVFIVIYNFILVATLGSFADTQLFPSFTLTAIGTTGIFERLDSIETAVWIFGIVLKLSFSLFICMDASVKAFPKLRKKTGLIICTIIVGAVSLLVSRDVTRLMTFTSARGLEILFITAVCLLPLFVLLIDAVSGRRNRDEKKKAS